MFEKNCLKCKNPINDMQNTIGLPLDYDICLYCWENMTDKQRQKHIDKGVVPITRFVVDEEWKEYCKKYGMRP